MPFWDKGVVTLHDICYNVLNNYTVHYNMVDQTTQHRGEKHYRNRLRECRLHSLISTQKELARKSGIDRTTISALENNRLFLSIHYALCLREVLGCSLDDLYERITNDAENRKAKRRSATRARA